MFSDASLHEIPDFGTVIERSRLVALVERAGCGLVVLAAPGGYGKSVLAALVAASERYGGRTWLACSGRRGTASELVAGLVDLSIDDDRPHCSVLDGVESSLGEEYAALRRAIRARPSGSLVIVTTRLEQSALDGADGCLLIGADQLLLSEEECASVLDSYGSDSGQASWLRTVTGGHPASATVFARHLAARPNVASNVVPDLMGAAPAGLASVVRQAAAQLTSCERESIWSAICLGNGTVEEVSRVCERDDPVSLLRGSRILPLVRVVGRPGRLRFSVHEIVATQLSMVGLAAHRSRALRARCVRVLSLRRDWARAGDLLLASGTKPEMLEWLDRYGEDVATCGEMRLLASLLSRCEAEDYVGQPALLILRAKVLWAQGDSRAALTTAAVASDLGRAGDDARLSREAALLASRIHLGEGSYSLACSTLDETVPDRRSAGTSTEEVQVCAQVLVARCLLADREGLHKEVRRAYRLQSTLPPGSEERARILSSLALVSYFYLGNLSRATRLLQLVAESRDASILTRLDARANHAVALLGLGRIDQARDAAQAAEETAEKLGFDSVSRTCNAILAGIRWCADGDYGAWRRDARPCVVSPPDAQDALTTSLDAMYHCELARAAGQLDDALAIVERGMHAASQTDAPLVKWALRLEHAATMAGHDDVLAAVASISDVAARARSAGIWPQRVKAGFVEAECLARQDRPDLAAHRLRELAGYIRSESANWLAAMYVRAYPPILGVLAAAVGVDRLPAHLLRLIPRPVAEAGLSDAHTALDAEQVASLSRRMLGPGDGGRPTPAEPPAPDETAPCTVRLFGAFEVRTPSGLVPDRAWGKRKARLLFAMMASRAGKDVPRDQLVDYLWPEMTQQRALNNFYVVWSAMKRALSPESGRNEPCPYVEHSRGVCRIVAGSLTTDLDEFDRLLNVVRKARAAGDEDIELGALHDLTEVYRGELLPGDAYDDWFGPLRERCRHDFEDAMLRLATLLEGRGDPQGGLAHLRRAILLDPWREDLYQAALRLQITAGQRSAAIETYLACRARLIEDLGIDPSDETRRLYEHVLCMEN